MQVTYPGSMSLAQFKEAVKQLEKPVPYQKPQVFAHKEMLEFLHQEKLLEFYLRDYRVITSAEGTEFLNSIKE
jgi:hypothetical protein